MQAENVFRDLNVLSHILKAYLLSVPALDTENSNKAVIILLAYILQTYGSKRLNVQ